MAGAQIVTRETGDVRNIADGNIGPGLSHVKNWLAAVIENSFDAILSKTLDGIITSWNGGAERLFGYEAAEAIGRPITMIIPDDRLSEETDIIARLRRGERIGRFETIRRRKDGSLVEVELTISPVRDEEGEIIGASKIARDISERRRQAEAQALLISEMSHRVKNLLSVVQALARSGRREVTVDEFAEDLCDRLGALAKAHDLLLNPQGSVGRPKGGATLDRLLQAILSPYLAPDRIMVSVPAIRLGRQAVTSLALIFHELATNAVKYGGLSKAEGRLSVSGRQEGNRLLVCWREEGGEKPGRKQEGFGTRLVRASLQGLGGTIEQHWEGGALELEIGLVTGRLGS